MAKAEKMLTPRCSYGNDMSAECNTQSAEYNSAQYNA